MRLEHVNVSVPDPRATAAVLVELFGWTIRWEGPALNDGFTVHVGDADGYLALYAPGDGQGPAGDTYHTTGGLNHIGIEVDDLEAVEARVKARGYRPHNHADYEPGRRFYFDGPDGIEFEVVAYD
ncbi:VOC family protein [Marinibacterium sp. SX1]|uniref:VOC family protein n=1 Tax=Marinibacterium sp. SX1 TaxID=3388424 RepID=UPI003D17B6DC